MFVSYQAFEITVESFHSTRQNFWTVFRTKNFPQAMWDFIRQESNLNRQRERRRKTERVSRENGIVFMLSVYFDRPSWKHENFCDVRLKNSFWVKLWIFLWKTPWKTISKFIPLILWAFRHSSWIKECCHSIPMPPGTSRGELFLLTPILFTKKIRS